MFYEITTLCTQEKNLETVITVSNKDDINVYIGLPTKNHQNVKQFF